MCVEITHFLCGALLYVALVFYNSEHVIIKTAACHDLSKTLNFNTSHWSTNCNVFFNLEYFV